MADQTGIEGTISDQKIGNLLEEAILMVQSDKVKHTLPIYIDLHGICYEIFAEGLVRYWKGRDEEDNPITLFADSTKEDFLGWFQTLPQDKKKEIYERLSKYERN